MKTVTGRVGTRDVLVVLAMSAVTESVTSLIYHTPTDLLGVFGHA